MSTSVSVLQGSPERTVKQVSLTEFDSSVHLAVLFLHHPNGRFKPRTFFVRGQGSFFDSAFSMIKDRLSRANHCSHLMMYLSILLMLLIM